MSYSIIASLDFEKELKSMVKKFPSLKKEYALLLENLESNPEWGIGIGNNFYKIRVGIRSKGRGKSGGARVITYVQIIKDTVYLLSIYDKSEQKSIADKEILECIKSIKK